MIAATHNAGLANFLRPIPIWIAAAKVGIDAVGANPISESELPP
jgi:hypothetical protein